MTLPDLDTRRSHLGDDAVLIATGIASFSSRLASPPPPGPGRG